MRWVLTSMTRPSAMSVNASPSKTLQASFELEVPGLNRIAALVHYLDVGGIQPVEAVGIAAGACGAARNHYR